MIIMLMLISFAILYLGITGNENVVKCNKINFKN